MKLHTAPFGELTVADEAIFNVPGGLIGFEDLKRYALITRPELEPFTWMVAIDEPEVMFALADPSLFVGEREIAPGRLDAESLDIEPGDEVSVHVIVTFTSPEGPVLGNVKGPIVLNRSNRMGCQMVLTDEAHDQPMIESSAPIVE